MSERVPLVFTGVIGVAAAALSVQARAPIPRLLFACLACGCAGALLVGLRQSSHTRRPWLWGLVAAFIATIAFAPVLCTTQHAESVNAMATEVTRCYGLLPVPTNVVLMVVMAVTAFVVAFRVVRGKQAHPGRGR